MYAATAVGRVHCIPGANSNYDIVLKIPILGIILWQMITKGASTNKTGRKKGATATLSHPPE